MNAPEPNATLHSALTPPLPARPGERLRWGRLYGAGAALAISQAARRHPGLVVALVDDVQAAAGLRSELQFFLKGDQPDTTPPLLGFPDWETLPYDVFSPLPELVSERLLTLHRLPDLKTGVLVVPVATLMQRLAPRDFVDGHSLVLALGERLDLDATRRRLERAGYPCVSQVMQHGEFAVRGSLLDCFPMGSTEPLRIDLLDDEVDSIRTFDPDTQRTRERLPRVRLLPAREFPLNEEAISAFRQRYRATFEGDPKASLIYREVSEGRSPGGLEYYLPLFFEQTATLFDYLPEGALVLESAGCRDASAAFMEGVEGRYEQRRHDIERPLLPPARLYLSADELAGRLNRLSGVLYQGPELEGRRKGFAAACNFATRTLPPLAVQARAAQPAQRAPGLPRRAGPALPVRGGEPGPPGDARRSPARLRHPARAGRRLGRLPEGRVRLGLTVAPLERGSGSRTKTSPWSPRPSSMGSGCARSAAAAPGSATARPSSATSPSCTRAPPWSTRSMASGATSGCRP